MINFLNYDKKFSAQTVSAVFNGSVVTPIQNLWLE
jgi:hypothetical protein